MEKKQTMSKRPITLLFVLLLLLVPVLLTACGADSVEDAVSQAGEVIEDAGAVVQENADAIAESAETVVDTVVEEAGAAVEEAQQAVEDAVADATDDEMVDEGPCAPATEGAFAGVDIRGVNILWWHNHSGSREEQLLPLVETFNETNDCGITVEAVNQGNYNDIRDAVNSSVAAGEVPAALVVGYQNDQAFYQLNGSLANLDDYIDDPTWGLGEEDKADFYASFFNQSIHTSFDNQRLGFPPNRSMEVLYYNETWLTELGFDSGPTTPDEFRTMACAAAEANGDGTGGYILRDDASAMAAWTFAFGGDVLTEDGATYQYNNPATIEAMTFLKGMYDDGCAYFFTEGFPNPEMAGRRAIFAQGSSSGIPFYINDMATVAEEQGREPDSLMVTAIPHTTAEPVQNVYGGDVMIVKTTPEQQLAAWEFIKWFTSPEIQAQWVEISNYFPTRAGTREFLGDYEAENAVWAVAADLLQYSAYEPQLISYQSVRDAAEEAFNEIMQGADIQSTLDNLTETANELQDELMAEIEG
jgi:multiple sugar transport system substrate-binding protein/sn-glycerol 3-phosphate transport system substrate-binding protein